MAKKTTKKTEVTISKKGNKSLNRENATPFAKSRMQQILRNLYLLDKYDMNYGRVATELGVARQTVRYWKNQFWDEYMKNKTSVKYSIFDTVEEKLTVVQDLAIYKGKIGTSFDKLISRLNEALDDEARMKNVRFSELVKGVEVLAPYLIDKVESMGVIPLDSPERHHSTLMQRIINNMNQKLPKNQIEDYDENGKD